MSETMTKKPALNPVLAALAWLWVIVPFGYGLVALLIKVPALFNG